MILGLLLVICVGYITCHWYLLRNLWYLMILFQDGSGEMFMSIISLNNRGPLLPYLWAVWGSDFVYTVIFVSSQCLVLEGNCCADGIAAMGHDIIDTTWFNTLPSSLLADFARDRHGLPS